MKLKIRPFDLRSMKLDRITYIIGKRGTGKTSLLKDILFNLRSRYDMGCGMSPTRGSVKFLERIMPNSFVFEQGYDEDHLCKVLALMKALVKRGKERHYLMVLDDCMADKKMMRTKAMRDVHLNGRHYWLTFFNCMQYLMDVGPDLRTQVDYLFVLKENINDNKQKLWKYFFGMFAKFEDFDRVMTACTENYSALVLDNTKPTTDPSECLFWYKAKDEERQFKLFRPIYWSLSHKYGKEVDDAEGDALLKPTRLHSKVPETFHGANVDPKDLAAYQRQMQHTADAQNPRVEVVVKEPRIEPPARSSRPPARFPSASQRRPSYNAGYHNHPNPVAFV